MLPPLTSSLSAFLFFFNDTATTEIYTLSLHDALPISPPRLFDLRFERFELDRVDDDQWIGGSNGRVLREPATHAAVLEARVIRSVVLELPAEDQPIELLGPAHVGRAELDVIDPPVMIALRHQAPSS